MMQSVFELARTPLGEALGQALIHFVWQGTLLGLIAAITLQMVSRADPRTRYTIGSVFLLLMAAAPVITFLSVLPKAQFTSAEIGKVAFFPAATSLDSNTQSIVQYALIAWSFGVALFGARAIGGWLIALRRLRSGRVPADASIETLVRQLSSRLGLTRAVRVFESARLDVPVVFGALRPILVLPASALTGLSSAHLEAIVAHELAHIARHDFLANCIQTAIEVLLFYHPAVWWLSARIRQERELCCDQVAVQTCGDGVLYSRALLQLEESRHSLALAANGGDLKSRIEHLLKPPTRSHLAGAHFVPVLLLAILIGCAAWPNQRANAMQKPDADEAAAEQKRRVDYANERFGSVNQPGTATARGAIYLQYGPPAEIESHPTERREAWRYSNGTIFTFEGDAYELKKTDGPPPVLAAETKAEFPAGPEKRIRVGGNTMSTKLVSKEVPKYPQAAKAQRVQGKVRLAVLVGKDGSVKDLYVMQGGPAGLSAAAESAVRGWIYEPTLLNGEPVEVVTVVDVNFTLTK